MTDPIADMLTRIKNALMARHHEVLVPHSKIKVILAKLLKENQYIEDYEVVAKKPQSEIKIKLRYVGKLPAITNVQRLSKPGSRVYASTKHIPQTLGGYGLTIVSTNKGVMTQKQARKQNLGGELLCKVW